MANFNLKKFKCTYGRMEKVLDSITSQDVQKGHKKKDRKKNKKGTAERQTEVCLRINHLW